MIKISFQEERNFITFETKEGQNKEVSGFTQAGPGHLDS